MNKKAMIKWLENFLTSKLNERSQRDMHEDLSITREESDEAFAGCEEKLIEMFLEWYNETVVGDLTENDIFLLGFAYGSFSVGEIDQGIHIVLPCTDEDGKSENDVFTSLFVGFFDKLTDEVCSKVLPENIGELYMGAIDAWLKEKQLDLIHENEDFIELYESTIKGEE